MKNKINILVTGVGGRSVGHQILHALLKVSEKYRIVATDADAFSFGLYQTENRYIIPRADDPQYIPTLLRLIAFEKIMAVFPGTEPEVRLLSKFRETIESSGCKVIVNPFEVVNLCSNKWRLYRWLKDNKIGTPKSVLSDEWKKLVAETGFPIIGKPTENTGASRSVAIIKDENEVHKFLEETDGSEVIFQEYCGDVEQEYTVGVLISKTGRVIDSIVVHRRLVGLSLGSKRMINGQLYALSSGYSQGFVIRHQQIQNFCEKLAVMLGIQGPVNIQCRIDGNDIKVFEVHPRFSGTTSIRADVGFNEPDVLIRNFLFDEVFEHLNYQTDVAAIRAFQNIIVHLSVMNSVSTP